MARHLLATVVMLALPVVASAQFRAPRAGGFGGGVRPAGPGVMPISPQVGGVTPFAGGISPVMPPISPGSGNFGGGFIRPGPHPVIPIWWGGGYPYYSYGYSGPTIVEVTAPFGGQSVPPPEPPANLSGEGTATLVLEFPATAEVWVNGKKGEGAPTVDWTLTSPAIQLGNDYTFEVKARWTANGKTYEYERTFTVGAGNRSKALVVAGKEVKE